MIIKNMAYWKAKNNNSPTIVGAPTKHLKSDDKVHMELWGDKHTNADHPDHWEQKKEDKTGLHNIHATKTEGTQEEQMLRKKRRLEGEKFSNLSKEVSIKKKKEEKEK